MWVAGLIIGLLAGTAAGLWPIVKKRRTGGKRKVIGHTTGFQSLEWYRKLVRGEITVEEWSKLTDDDLKAIKTLIYEDEINTGRSGEDKGNL